MAYQTLLVPHDFSPHSDAALDTAIDLAKAFGAKLDLVHVYHRPALIFEPYGVQPVEPLITEIPEAAKRRLQRELDKVLAAGVEATAEVIEGSASETLVALSAKVDLIVMGTHGFTGLPHVLLGSVAERTVRLAECPVLTVKAPAED